MIYPFYPASMELSIKLCACVVFVFIDHKIINRFEFERFRLIVIVIVLSFETDNIFVSEVCVCGSVECEFFCGM